MSVTINPNALPSFRAEASSASACSPPSASTGTISQRLSIPSRIRRLVWLSSTTSTRTPRNTSGGAGLPTFTSLWSAICSRTVKWKSLPRPSSLSTQIRPPIIRTRRFEIVSPSPVPPYFRVVELSACANGSKINSRLFSGIPMPVSETVKCTIIPHSSFASCRAFTATSPSLVNLMALPTRFSSTCLSRVISPRATSGTSGATSQRSSSPFSSARTARVFSADSRLSRTSKSTDSRSSLPASILEKSRISLITVSKESADTFTVSRHSLCPRFSSVSRAKSVMPMMPFSGVRISWLILAKNSLFARLAASATSRALCISACILLR